MKDNVWKTYKDNDIKKLDKICDEYKDFISISKTERESVTNAIKMAEEYGFKDLNEYIDENIKLNSGDKVYVNNRGKSLALFVIGEEDIEEGINILGAHVDSPRLDLKASPLYEDSEFAYLDTHYYGGIKKYQWVTLPLALHGVVVKKDLEKVMINIGEDEFDPAMYGLVDVILCPTNKKREEVNGFIRHACGYDVSPFPFFGERIICRQNNWNIVYDDLALANGLSGYAYSLPKPVENASDVFYMDFKPDLTNYVFPDIMMNAEYICANYDRRNEMKSLIKQYPINGELFEYAYAITYHLSQGAEYPNVMMIEENMRPQIANQMLYTAITRAKRFLLFVKQKVNRYY